MNFVFRKVSFKRHLVVPASSMPLAHLVDPFKQVNLIVNDEVDTNGHTTGSTGEMQVEEVEAEDSDMREIEVGRSILCRRYSELRSVFRYKM